MKITQLNHVAVHVVNLAASERFYGEVLGLAQMDRPAFNFAGAWFRIGVDQELHLIARQPKDDEPYTIPTERHFALMVDDADAAAARLRERGVDFRGPNLRPDRAKQIFLRDPDGHVVELCSVPGAGPGD
ncbi:MAG: VOC family protein [Phycisphaeraceae bacterium]